MASPDINTEDYLASIDFLSNYENVDKEKIGITGICGWDGLALNAATLDTRIKATLVSTMYDMSRVNANEYFEMEDSEESRYQKKLALNEQRTKDFKSGEYEKAGGVIDWLPEDAPQFVKDYHDVYKTSRCYHIRSLNSNDGWNVIGQMFYLNQPILQYTNEIRSAVLVIHVDKAHSYYFGKDVYENMIKDSKYTENKEFLTIEGASHIDLYDRLDVIPFERIREFFGEYLG